MGVILDTCFLIDLDHGHPGAVKMLKTTLATREELWIPSIVAAEYWSGTKDLSFSTGVVKGSATILPFGAREAERTAELSHRLKSEGLYPGKYDVMIAAIVETNGNVPIITRNGRHFPYCETLEY